MKRVGIITHYYNSNNYGGVLQSYALCKVINDIGHNCEQICYDSSSTRKKTKKSVKQIITNIIVNVFFMRKWKKRRMLISKFRNGIPHSKIVYTKNSIKKCVDEYDVFITGSDQVWNLKSYHPAYFLNFVPSNKCKLSYAASICTDAFDENEKKIVIDSLKDYNAISVREKDSVSLLSNTVKRNIKWVVDPVFLLSSEQWDKICFERLLNEDYLFCYFLGDGKKERELATEYAKIKGLKVVTIDNVLQTVSKASLLEISFGDIRLNDVSPEQFLSLIKYSNSIFTDSFHAVAFSIIYEKQFFIFERENQKKMGVRISSILELLNAPERFVKGNTLLIDYLLNLDDLNYKENQQYIESMIKESLLFLKENIK